MHSLAIILALAASVSSTVAFNYTIGVGKDEVTGNLTPAGFDPSRTVVQSPSPNFLVFDMFGGTHQVVQTSFSAPCTPSRGFDTGVVTVPDGTGSGGPEFTWLIPDSSAPTYFADIAENHCQSGAVFCLNTDETSSESCNAFKLAAQALGGGTTSTTSGNSGSLTRPISVQTTTPTTTSTPAASPSTSAAPASTTTASATTSNSAESAPAATTTSPSSSAGTSGVTVLTLIGGITGLIAVLFA